MREFDAAEKADKFICLLLEHQEDVLGKYPLSSADAVMQAAQSLAKFRQELIALLKQQP